MTEIHVHNDWRTDQYEVRVFVRKGDGNALALDRDGNWQEVAPGAVLPATLIISAQLACQLDLESALRARLVDGIVKDQLVVGNIKAAIEAIAAGPAMPEPWEDAARLGVS